MGCTFWESFFFGHSDKLCNFTLFDTDHRTPVWRSSHFTEHNWWRIPTYQLFIFCFRGKFGTVYLCREKSTGLELAAKLVAVNRRDERRNVEREVDVMRRLRHPRLIQLYDAYDWGKYMCVVLELWVLFIVFNIYTYF